MIIMDTLKSKGFAPGEGISACHSMAFSKEVAEEAIAELERQYAAGGER